MSLNGPVLAMNVAGACIASSAIIPLRDVTGLVRAPGLRLAWTGLTFIMVCCIGLLLAASAADLARPLDGWDLAASGIHVLGPCFVLGVVSLSRRTAHDLLRIEALEEAAFVDPLTGLANRRRFDERLADEVRRARAIGLPLSLLALDIDHFKRVNDTHGHAAGDLVLKQVATLIAAKSRHLDTPCRVGGEEFVVIVPGLEGGFAAAAAERLRRAVAETTVSLQDGGELRATVSLGLATLRPGETADMLSRRADAALYGAKREGRDRVSLAA
ncbi:GGDEF domain-containing protein [Lichenibacterium dinghuense]|uniref:GGDEF domain-containing protein n=1 Tax=Lichenibacterium dinghuense TaxID=2895977 RepID=UPI001F3037F5|nr:GGDEF domain-containing protein [Lichenibacterium sp. 6Y81]